MNGEEGVGFWDSIVFLCSLLFNYSLRTGNSITSRHVGGLVLEALEGQNAWTTRNDGYPFCSQSCYNPLVPLFSSRLLLSTIVDITRRRISRSLMVMVFSSKDGRRARKKQPPGVDTTAAWKKSRRKPHQNRRRGGRERFTEHCEVGEILDEGQRLTMGGSTHTRDRLDTSNPSPDGVCYQLLHSTTQ